MKVNFAHINHRGINFAVFDVDARSRMAADRADLLADLTVAARRLGLRVEKSALAYVSGGRIEFYGTPDLVRFLANMGPPQWTHVLTV